MKRYNIPFSPPDMSEAEILEVAEALRSGWITTGPKTKEFERQIAAGNLLEYAKFVGNYYGTPKDYVEKLLNSGKNVFLEIEIDGARQVVEKIPNAVTIYLMPPSIEELERRIRGRRSEPEEVVKERMDKAKREIKCYTEYKYVRDAHE